MDEIVRALVLLASLGIQDVPLVQAVDKAPEFKYPRPVVSVAYVVSGEPLIYVVRSSEAFKKAAKGDARQLAATIAHEIMHIQRGAHEGPAYAEELRVLKAFKVGGNALHRVKQAAELFRYDWPNKD